MNEGSDFHLAFSAPRSHRAPAGAAAGRTGLEVVACVGAALVDSPQGPPILLADGRLGGRLNEELAALRPGDAGGLDALARGLRGSASFVCEATDSEGRDWVVVATDRFGNPPVFWGIAEGRTLVLGTSALEVARRLPKPSVDAAAAVALCALEFIPGQRTLYTGVAELPPASWCTFSRREDGDWRLDIRRYWRVELGSEAFDPRQEQDFEVAWAGELRRVMGDWAGAFAGEGKAGGVLLPLSGGLDSRQLLALMIEGGVSPIIGCYGSGDSLEVLISRRVSQFLNMPHHHVPFFGADVLGPPHRQTLAQAIGATTRLTLADGGWVLARQFGRGAEATSPRAAFAAPGHSGDGMSGSRLDASAAADADDAVFLAGLVRKQWSAFRRAELPGLLRPELRAQPTPEDFLRESMDAPGARNGFERRQAWVLQQLVRRRVVPELTLYRRTLTPTLPYFDARLLDFIATVPIPLLFKQRLYVNAALRHVFRGHMEGLLRSIPLAGRGLAAPQPPSATKRVEMLAHRVFNQMLRRVAPEVLERRTTACPMTTLHRRDAAFAEGVLSDIRGAVVLPDIFQHEPLMRFVRERAGRQMAFTHVGLWGLVTVELAGRALLGGPTQRDGEVR